LNDLLGDGIFAVDGEKWREQRKISSHVFSTKMLRDFSTIIFRKNAAKVANSVSEAANSNTKIEIQVSKYIPVIFIRDNLLFLIH
jgi:cytochrome P450